MEITIIVNTTMAVQKMVTPPLVSKSHYSQRMAKRKRKKK